MRKASAIFVASIVTLALLTAPVLAKNSGAQRTDDEQASSSCHAYEQNPDGSWKPLPCQELGSGTKTPAEIIEPKRGRSYALNKRSPDGAAPMPAAYCTLRMLGSPNCSLSPTCPL